MSSITFKLLSICDKYKIEPNKKKKNKFNEVQFFQRDVEVRIDYNLIKNLSLLVSTLFRN